MGYIPPEYSALQKKTETILESFNRLCRRYIPAKYDELCKKVESLEGKYNEEINKKKGWLVNTNPELRRDQTACISQLLSKLPKEGTPQLLNQAQNILLGAIFYRFKRIFYSYEGTTYYLFGYNPKDSTLYQVLDAVFQLENKLDAETLATCCEAYKAYLEQPDINTENRKTVGEQFPYIQEDKNFYANLQKIITKARQAALPITSQLHVIAFVESVAHSLRETDKAVSDAVPKLSKLVLAKLTKSPLLNRENLIELLNSVHPPIDEASKEILKLGLPDQVVPQGVWVGDGHEGNYINFQEYLLQALAINSKYTLLGAYIMGLGRCNSHTPKLKDVLNEGIGALGENQLDEATRELALIAFKNYVDIPGKPKLNCRSWSADTGEEHMKADLEIRLNKLRHIIEATF